MSDTPEWPDIKIVPRFCGQPYISFHKSDTPETDAIADDGNTPWNAKTAQFMMLARRLERERDEARRVGGELRKQCAKPQAT